MPPPRMTTRVPFAVDEAQRASLAGGFRNGQQAE
jgi:hypothetical protein